MLGSRGGLLKSQGPLFSHRSRISTDASVSLVLSAHVVPQGCRILERLVGTDWTGRLWFSISMLVLNVSLQVVPVLENLLTVRTLD